eukprot:363648-Chlamydomonas_euryale.AAC.4
MPARNMRHIGTSGQAATRLSLQHAAHACLSACLPAGSRHDMLECAPRSFAPLGTRHIPDCWPAQPPQPHNNRHSPITTAMTCWSARLGALRPLARGTYPTVGLPNRHSPIPTQPHNNRHDMLEYAPRSFAPLGTRHIPDCWPAQPPQPHTNRHSPITTAMTCWSTRLGALRHLAHGTYPTVGLPNRHSPTPNATAPHQMPQRAAVSAEAAPPASLNATRSAKGHSRRVWAGPWRRPCPCPRSAQDKTARQHSVACVPYPTPRGRFGGTNGMSRLGLTSSRRGERMP